MGMIDIIADAHHTQTVSVWTMIVIAMFVVMTMGVVLWIIGVKNVKLVIVVVSTREIEKNK